MTSTILATNDVRTIRLSGRLTADRADERLPDMIGRLAGQGTRSVVLDLGHVSYMDSTCLGELIEACVGLHATGGQLALINVPPRVQYLLDLSGVGAIVDRPHRRPVHRQPPGSAA